MAILSLTADNFDATVARSPCLLVEFSSNGEDFAERAGQLADLHGVDCGLVDPRTEADLMATFGIEGDTALLIFRDQVVLYLKAGRHDAGQMADLVGKILALDMPSIKAQIEANKQAQLALRMRRVCPTARRGPMEG
jgi:hypothetical protein